MKNIKRNFILNLLNQMLGIAVPLITTPYLARILGAEQLGVFSYANSVCYYFVLFGMLGIANYGSREIAKVRDDSELLSKTASGIYTTQVLCATAASVAYLGYLLIASSVISRIMLISVIAVYLDINWYYYGQERFDLILLRNALVKLLTTVLIFIAVKDSSGVNKYALIVSGGTVLGNALLWPTIRNDIKYVRPTLIEIRKHLLANLTLFIPLLVLSFYKVMDKLMLKWLTTYTQVGYYECADKLGQVPLYLFSALSQIMIPRISFFVSKGEETRASAYFEKSIEFVSFLSTSIIFGIVAVSDVFVPFYFGDGYESCINLTKVLIVSYIFSGYANVMRSQLLIPYSKDREFAVSLTVGACLNFCLNMILVPHLLALGAAIATAITEAAVFMLTFYYARSNISLIKLLNENWVYYVLGFIMLATVTLIPLPNKGLVLIIEKVFLGATTYGIIFVLWQLKKRLKQ